jgi:hypothetical protein
MLTTRKACEGNLVEWASYYHGPRLGIVRNIPPRRMVGKVLVLRRDGRTASVQGSDGSTSILPLSALTVIADRAEAGWANLA